MTRTKRLQNKVTSSKATLPVVAVYAIVIAALLFVRGERIVAQFAILAVSAFCMLQINRTYSLIRVYSRMVSCPYIMLFVMCDMLLLPVECGVVQLCFILFYLLLFGCYQNHKAAANVFYAFLMLGIASLFFVQTFYFLPVAIILMYGNALAGNVKTFFAALIGIATPYWFAAGYLAYTDDLQLLADHFKLLTTFGDILAFEALSPNEIATVSLVGLLSVIGIAHLRTKSYLDKIRTRLFYGVFTTMWLCTALFLALQPQHYDFLIGLLVISAAPLIGHFVALTGTRLTNTLFIILTLSVLALTALNLWKISPSF